MTQARTAGSGALFLFVPPAGASTQTSLPVGRQRDGGSGVGVTFGGGCLRFRYTHRSFCRKSKTRCQGYQQNTQHEASHGISLHRSSLRNECPLCGRRRVIDHQSTLFFERSGVPPCLFSPSKSLNPPSVREVAADSSTIGAGRSMTDRPRSTNRWQRTARKASCLYS